MPVLIILRLWNLELGGGALPLVPSPLLVAARWDRGEVTLGRLTAIPLRRVTLQG